MPLQINSNSTDIKEQNSEVKETLTKKDKKKLRKLRKKESKEEKRKRKLTKKIQKAEKKLADVLEVGSTKRGKKEAKLYRKLNTEAAAILTAKIENWCLTVLNNATCGKSHAAALLEISKIANEIGVGQGLSGTGSFSITRELEAKNSKYGPGAGDMCFILKKVQEDLSGLLKSIVDSQPYTGKSKRNQTLFLSAKRDCISAIMALMGTVEKKANVLSAEHVADQMKEKERTEEAVNLIIERRSLGSLQAE